MNCVHNLFTLAATFCFHVSLTTLGKLLYKSYNLVFELRSVMKALPWHFLRRKQIADGHWLNTTFSELFGFQSTYINCGHFRILLDVQIELENHMLVPNNNNSGR